MKNLLLLLIITVGLMSMDIASVPSDNVNPVQLNAIRLESSLATQLKSLGISTFSIDNKGILRPQKNHQIYYYKVLSKIIIKPTNHDQKATSYIDSIDSVPLPDGAGEVFCMCEFQNSKDCTFKFNEEKEGNRTEFKCMGSCGCGVWVDLNPTERIPEYQSSGGEWFSF